jgi:hypothetical protein
LKLAKRDSEKDEKPPADTKKDAEPELPCREDTDKYKVAKAFLTVKTIKRS